MSGLVLEVLLLTVVFGFHLAEETLTALRARFPLEEKPRWIFVSLNGLLYAYCGTTLVLAHSGQPAAEPLVLGVDMLANGIGRLGVMVCRRANFPGGASAAGFVPAALVLLEELI